MMGGAIGVASIVLSTLPRSGPVQAEATVPGVSVYVTTSRADGKAGAELIECAKSLRQALTPSLGTLVPAKARGDADVVVQLTECEIDNSANVYEVDWVLSMSGSSEDLKTRRTLTPSRTDDRQMRATTKALARELLRKLTPPSGR